jgi:YidC/Oxa1 family membrane protein insertase
MGFLDPLSKALGWLLAFFYSIIPNTGVAIILLTVAVRVVLFPLTAKQAKSMIAMQRVQPELKKLQAKYKNDRQKLSEETMKFYKENQINPLSGCLPLVLQLPIWIALVETLRHIQEFIPKSSQMYLSVCGSHTSCHNPSLTFLGMDLTKSAANAGGLPGAIPYYVLVALLVVTMFVQQRQMMRFQTQVNPQMQMMSRVMPAVFGALSFIYPSGVALYFLVSTVWQIGQQELVIRTMDNAPPGAKAKTVEAASRVVEGDESAPKPATGLKGMFGNLRAQPQLANGDDSQNGANGDEANGGKAAQSAKGAGASGAAAKSGGAARGGSGSGGGKSSGQKTGGAAKSGGAKSGGGQGSGGGGQSNRRRNNRKRKR